MEELVENGGRHERNKVLKKETHILNGQKLNWALIFFKNAVRD